MYIDVYVWVYLLQLQQLCMCMSQDLLLLAEEEVGRKDRMTVEDVVLMRVSYSLVFSLWLVLY